MLNYDRIDVLKGIEGKKPMIHKIVLFWFLVLFRDIDFKFQLEVCNGCHDLLQKSISFNDVTIISVKANEYRTHFW